MTRAAAIVALLLLAAAPSPAAAEDIYVEAAAARMRSGPGTNYSILWEAPRNTPFEYLAKYKDWYAVRDFEGDVAWVQESVIGKGKAAVVTNKKANIRSAPSQESAIVFWVEKGYLFRVLDQKGEWYKVRDKDNSEGWVNAPLVWVSR